jgi:branched-chain amino acid transport system ATP-binding protein
MALLELSDVCLSFAGLRALATVSFSVQQSEIVGLIGPNGAGKSTLLNCVSRLYRWDSGSIRFDGQDLIARRAPEVASMGVRRTFQNLELFREVSVRDNVTLGLAYRYRGTLLSDFFDLPFAREMRLRAYAEANEIIAKMGLSGVADARVSELSYGVQKSVEMARALAGRPKLMLLDEPAAGVNPEESRRVAQTTRRLRDENGVSIILVEHDMRVVMSACDRIIVLDHGEKIAEGTPAEIRNSPAVMVAYLGEDAEHA